jgi:hypothetical protein
MRRLSILLLLATRVFAQHSHEAAPQAAIVADAARVFERDLQRNPHNPRSLWGLAAARRGDKKLTAEYRRRWKGAPLTLASF